MSQDARNLSRRGAMLLTAGTGAAALAGAAQAADGTKTGSHQDPGNCTTPRSAVADTRYGKVRGFLDGGVFTGFKAATAPAWTCPRTKKIFSRR